MVNARSIKQLLMLPLLALLLTYCAGVANALAARLATSEASGNSCTAAASKATARAAMVLADVLKRADERAGNLVEYAEQSRGRGVTCEPAYDGIQIAR